MIPPSEIRRTVQTKIQEQFCLETRPDPCGMVIFGASGDLAERKLYPSLFNLKRSGGLPAHFYAVGAGRTPLDDDAFRERVRASIKESAAKADEGDITSFLKCFYYHALDYADAGSYAALAKRLPELDKRHETRGNRMFYLSVPPSLYETVVERLGGAGLARQKTGGAGWSRVIIEKPFGRDAASAAALSTSVRKVFSEDQTYRIDHYLGKETVQNILVLRFANIFFEPIWNRNYIDNVQITAAESLGVGHRAGYYEEAGVVRDMFQNHLLQLLCVTAMEAPPSFSANRVRDEKAKVLMSLRPMPVDAVDRMAVRGQYGGGAVDGRPVPAYRGETGVKPDSRTETFAAMKLFIDNWRWQGVPFYLRSGKRMNRRVTEVTVQFKPVPHLLFSPLRPGDILPNKLTLRIQPQESVSLSMEAKVPGPKLCMGSVDMDFCYAGEFGEPAEAYERLFLDCMAGDQTLFTRVDWVKRSWAFLTPLLERWSSSPASPPIYPAGGWGPPEADALLAEAGHAWRNGDL